MNSPLSTNSSPSHSKAVAYFKYDSYKAYYWSVPFFAVAIASAEVGRRCPMHATLAYSISSASIGGFATFVATGLLYRQVDEHHFQQMRKERFKNEQLRNHKSPSIAAELINSATKEIFIVSNTGIDLFSHKMDGKPNPVCFQLIKKINEGAEKYRESKDKNKLMNVGVLLRDPEELTYKRDDQEEQQKKNKEQAIKNANRIVELIEKKSKIQKSEVIKLREEDINPIDNDFSGRFIDSNIIKDQGTMLKSEKIVLSKTAQARIYSRLDGKVYTIFWDLDECKKYYIDKIESGEIEKYCKDYRDKFIEYRIRAIKRWNKAREIVIADSNKSTNSCDDPNMFRRYRQSDFQPVINREGTILLHSIKLASLDSCSCCFIECPPC